MRDEKDIAAREAKLAAFLAKDEPPQRDVVFEARVAMQRPRGRAVGGALKLGAAAAAGVAILWAVAPSLGALDWWPYGLAAASVAFSGWLIVRQFSR